MSKQKYRKEKWHFTRDGKSRLLILPLQGSNLASSMVLPKVFSDKGKENWENCIWGLQALSVWHSRILDVTKSTGHYDKINTQNMFSSRQNKRKRR